jgi:hypothetical protein
MLSRSRLSTALVLVGLFALAFAASASAKGITKVASTNITLSVKKAANGTVTARATYTSPNPRCLGAKRWKKQSDGVFEGAPEFALYYGESDYARPPGGTELTPNSSFGRSPFVWQAVWPGSAKVVVERGHAKTEAEAFYNSTVGAAIGIDGGASTPAFEDVYTSGGNKIHLKCLPTKPLNEHLRNQLFP